MMHCYFEGFSLATPYCDADAQLLCESCMDKGSKGMRVSAGLRKSIEAVLAGGNVRLHAADAACWRDMIRQALQEHGIKATDSFKVCSSWVIDSKL